MSEKRRSVGVFSIALSEIFLLCLATVAVSFILSSSSMVSAEEISARIVDSNGNTVKKEVSSLSNPGGAGSLPSYAIANIPAEGTAEVVRNGITYKGISGNGITALGDGKYRFEFGSAVDSSGNSVPATFEGGSAELQAVRQGFGQSGVEIVEKEKFEFLGTQIATGGWAHLLQGASWALAVAGAIQLIGSIAGLDKTLTNSLSIAAIAGIMTYKGLASLGPSGFNFITNTNSVFLQYAGVFGIAAAAITFVLLYKKEKKKVVTLQCLPWEAPLGGSDCEKCNGDPLKPCSEYRCKSLGQACDLVNKGTNEERCVWVSRNDVNSPTIQPRPESLKPVNQNLKFIPDNTIRPPNRGVKIVSGTAGGCIAPYTPLEFGIKTDEPAQCKISTERPNGTKAFDSMEFYFGNSNYFGYNHTQVMRLPSPEAIANESEGLELENNGIFNYFVRCRDANGNENVDDFVINFCVDKSPDTTPPVIESTSIISGSPVTFGVQNISLTAYVNEPSECKWSVQDKNYNDMENTMQCASKVYQQNAQQLYPCTTTLNGIKDLAVNNYYFRCKDQPFKSDSERNVNSESYKFSLRGSQALTILKVAPNSTITGSTDVVQVNLTVETSNGADEGSALCYFSPSGTEGSFVKMFSTNNYKHSQILTLSSGNYSYYFRCTDAGGNAASNSTRFSVYTDRAAPAITRIYREGPDALKLVTNEDAECTYSTSSCNYNIDEGLKMIYNPPTSKNQHYARWEPSKTYYIKCRDSYGNQPTPNTCSIIASATNVKFK